MALLSTRGIYGIMAVFEIAKGDREHPVSLKEISTNINVSKNYLEQLLNILRGAGIIASIKGLKGGFYLNKPLKELTLCDIFMPLENGFGLININLDNTPYEPFFSEYNERLIAIFNQPLSELAAYKDRVQSYSNYII